MIQLKFFFSSVGNFTRENHLLRKAAEVAGTIADADKVIPDPVDIAIKIVSPIAGVAKSVFEKLSFTKDDDTLKFSIVADYVFW